MTELWGHGMVWVSDKTKHPRVLRANLPFVEALRLAAVYACKYAVKDWDPEMIGPGRHRYECAEGFEPVRVVEHVERLAEAVEFAEDVFGATPETVWCSLDFDQWDGPLAYCLRWATPAGRASGAGGGGPDG
jgi:hypothetical protein